LPLSASLAYGAGTGGEFTTRGEKGLLKAAALEESASFAGNVVIDGTGGLPGMASSLELLGGEINPTMGCRITLPIGDDGIEEEVVRGDMHTCRSCPSMWSDFHALFTRFI
jgi:hypothetical protein